MPWGPAQGGQAVEIVRCVEEPDHQPIGDDGARRFGARWEETERVAGADHQGLGVVHDLEVALDEQVLHPVLADLAGLAVGHKLVGVEGNLEVEVVVDHHLHCLRFGDAADVGVDGPAGDLARGPVAIAVDPAPGAKLFEELRRHHLVVFRRHVAQRILQRDDSVVAVEVKTAIWCPTDPGFEIRGLWQLSQLDSQNGLGHLILRRSIVSPPVSVSVSVPARRPRSSPTATRSRIACLPSASARRPRHPPTLRAFGAPAGCIRGSQRHRTLFPAPPPRPPALGKPRRAEPAATFREVGVFKLLIRG